MKHNSRTKILLAVAMSLCFLSSDYGAIAKALLRIAPNAGPSAPGPVSLPYCFPQSDSSGNQWMLYPGGMLRQQGNMPVFGEGPMLLINNSQPSLSNNQAKLDPSGEIILENMTASGCTVTRRISQNKDDGSLRIIDVIRNTQPHDQTFNLMFRSNINYGIRSSQNITDPKRKDQPIGSIIQDSRSRSVLAIYAGKGSKALPTILTQPNNNSYMQASMSVTIPAKKEAAILHLHLVCTSPDTGMKFASSLKEMKLLKTIPQPIRKLIVNFTGGQEFIGDYEILRGDIFDVIELRGIDQFKGNLQETTFKLATFYGTIELPADRIIGLINVGSFRPRQLLITSDGQIFGGQLQQDTLKLQLSSGQITQIPLSQITRLGYRKRPGEPDEWTFDKPLVVMNSGDRISVQLPSQPLTVVTRYGTLNLNPESIASITFQNEEQPVHQITLTDGSKFAGLVSTDQFEMKLPGPAPEQIIKIPLCSASRLQFNSKSTDIDDATPILNLANDDQMVGTFQGQLKLNTAFDTLTINAAEIKSLTRNKISTSDVQITLWDDSSVSGQLQSPLLDFQLRSGTLVRIPIALVEGFTQPQPIPSSAMTDKIKSIVTQLNADDWKERDRAESQLVTMGQPIIPVLKQLRPSQPPEAQQRIDSILKQLEKQPDKSKPTTPPTPINMEE